MTNQTVELLKNHRSIRRFKNEDIPDEILNELFSAGQWAPTSHNVQAYSIIKVKDQTKKGKLSELCGSQKYVANCPVFLIFCIDFYRLHRVSEMYHTNFEIDEVENLLVGAVDTALVAENVFTAAKSYGLGGVMIGGIRNDLESVKTVLNLPKYVIPLMGMCLGYPNQEVWQKPRLPQRVVVHEEEYKEQHINEGLLEYEDISADYYTRRTNGKKTDGWTKQMSDYLSKPRRANVTPFVKKQGIELT